MVAVIAEGVDNNLSALLALIVGFLFGGGPQTSNPAPIAGRKVPGTFCPKPPST